MSKLVDLISMDPLTNPKRPNLQNELSSVVLKLKERQFKQHNEIKA